MTNTYETIADLLPLQKKLDDTILANCGKTREETFAQRIIALNCEFYEFLNEWRGFKYWSKKKPVVWMESDVEVGKRLLDEACDVLHFLLSLFYDCHGDIDGNDFYFYVDYNNRIKKCVDRTEIGLIEVFEDELADFSRSCRISELGYAVHTFLKLCERFGITEQLLIAAYLQKNEVNHERQEQGY